MIRDNKSETRIIVGEKIFSSPLFKEMKDEPIIKELIDLFREGYDDRRGHNGIFPESDSSKEITEFGQVSTKALKKIKREFSDNLKNLISENIAKGTTDKTGSELQNLRKETLIPARELAYFLFDINENDYALIKKVNKNIGKIKDGKATDIDTNEIKDKLGQYFEIYKNLKPGTIANFNKKYERYLLLITEAIKKGNKMGAEDFHEIRKKLRAISILFLTVYDISNKEELYNLGEKYSEISKKMGEIYETHKDNNGINWFEEYEALNKNP